MKRIDELTRLRRDAERDRDYWREFAMRSTPKDEPKAPGETAPTELAREEVRRLLAEERLKAAEEARTKSFQAREREFSKTVEDYAEVAHYAPISREVAELVKELDGGPEVAYYLGKNPDVAERISGLSERAAAIELGRLEVRLAAEREKVKAKPVTKAPAPPPTIDASEPGVRVKATEPESDKLSIEEWTRLREKELLRKKG
jgi:hypothetical protein